VHEGSFHAFSRIAERGAPVAEPGLTFGVADHYVPTRGSRHAIANPEIARMVRQFEENTAKHQIKAFGLDDPRFDVRFQSARSLASIVEKNPLVQIDSAQIFAVVLREVAVGRGVWESRRLLDGADEDKSPTTLDEFVRTRAGESLAHVFTLLSLVLPREPLQIAYRGLQSSDRRLRGTALEYLEGTLPPDLRAGVLPLLVRRPARSVSPSRLPATVSATFAVAAAG
jgi:hypothetical protein